MVRLTGHPIVEAAITSFGDYIKEEVLADTLSIDNDIDGEDVDLIDGVTIKLRLAR